MNNINDRHWWFAISLINQQHLSYENWGLNMSYKLMQCSFLNLSNLMTCSFRNESEKCNAKNPFPLLLVKLSYQ